jgi:hypothetical protein
VTSELGKHVRHAHKGLHHGGKSPFKKPGSGLERKYPTISFSPSDRFNDIKMSI